MELRNIMKFDFIEKSVDGVLWIRTRGRSLHEATCNQVPNFTQKSAIWRNFAKSGHTVTHLPRLMMTQQLRLMPTCIGNFSKRQNFILSSFLGLIILIIFLLINPDSKNVRVQTQFFCQEKSTTVQCKIFIKKIF